MSIKTDSFFNNLKGLKEKADRDSRATAQNHSPLCQCQCRPVTT